MILNFDEFVNEKKKSGMNIQAGQDKDIKKKFPNYDKETSSIVAEGGNDNGETFRGSFLVQIGKSTYKFKDGEFVNKVK